MGGFVREPSPPRPTSKEWSTMKYLVRLNPKAFNPLTRKVVAKRLWEIEQCATKDSEKYIWHCADVRINSTPISQFFRLVMDGEKSKTWEKEVYGICLRGQDDVVEIRTGKKDASGN